MATLSDRNKTRNTAAPEDGTAWAGERYDLDADIGDLDMESAEALLNLTALWQARRALRWRWSLRARIARAQPLDLSPYEVKE